MSLRPLPGSNLLSDVNRWCRCAQPPANGFDPAGVKIVLSVAFLGQNRSWLAIKVVLLPALHLGWFVPALLGFERIAFLKDEIAWPERKNLPTHLRPPPPSVS